MTGHGAWVLLAVIFAGGVAVGGLVVSLAGSRREDRAYHEGRADEAAERDEMPAPALMRAAERLRELRDPSGPDAAGPGAASPSWDSSGPEVTTAWAPQPGDRVYQWAHPHPIRATAPLTVIDWDALPWEERQLLTVWDWGRRMQAWVEDWDRDDLEGAAA